MELWQMDVMGGIRLTDGSQLSVVTGIDDHSRFCVIARLVARATARPVCDALVEGLARYGVPSQILTDNAKVFTGKLAHKPAVVLFDRICLNNGIRHLLTAPYSPTTTGKVERLHKTLRKEFFGLTSFETIEKAQAGLDAWVDQYNRVREHQGIGDVPPDPSFRVGRSDRLRGGRRGDGDQRRARAETEPGGSPGRYGRADQHPQTPLPRRPVSRRPECHR
jgi:transposase InsO family protein